MPAPQLSLSPNNQAKLDLLMSVELKAQIMEYLAEGHSWLEASQKFNMSEKQVSDFLDEAYRVRTDRLRNSAEHLQTFIFEQHQEMYLKAKQYAFPSPVEKDGKLISLPPDLYWFREMRAELNEMQNILKQYVGTTQDTKDNFIFTFIDNSQFEKFVRTLQHYDGMTIYDRS